MSGLEIKNLYVSVHEKQIIENFSLTVPKGEIHAIMGPNGTGKSTLSYTIMGHPAYKASAGDILMNGERINDWTPDRRSHAGLFLALQYPVAVPGVTVANFLRTALNTQRKARDPEDHGIPVPAFRKLLREKMNKLKMDSSFASRYLNDGFPAVKKSAPRSCRWLFYSRRSPSWMRSTPVWISTLSVSLPKASICLYRKTIWVSWSSRTISGSWITSNRMLFMS